jgi:hypothetical protein
MKAGCGTGPKKKAVRVGVKRASTGARRGQCSALPVGREDLLETADFASRSCRSSNNVQKASKKTPCQFVPPFSGY